ncbi:MAG: radical SAM/SPASM domain-containing protein [Myxococcota bacterium]
MPGPVPPPGFIEVELGAYCNRRCAWCPNGWHERGLSRASMKDAVWRSLLEDLSRSGYSGWFAFHNYNEPMADPRLLERVADARRALPHAKLELHTNGDFLTPARLRELLEAGIDLTRVTLYPTNARAFEEPDPARATRFFAKLHVKPRPLVEKESKLERHGRLGRMQLIVRLPRIAHYTDRLGAVGLAGLEAGSPRTTPCLLPFHSAAIDYHGTLKLCCHVYDTTAADQRAYALGNVGETPFSALWASPRLQELRAQLARADFSRLPGCARCTHRTPAWMRSLVVRQWADALPPETKTKRRPARRAASTTSAPSTTR